SAQTGFDYGYVHTNLGKIQKHQSDGEFEERQRQPCTLVDVTQPLYIVQHYWRSHLGTVNTGPLGQVHQMRFGVQAASEACRAETSIEHRSDRALAFSSGNMHRA